MKNRLIVCGVNGAGKSTLGAYLARLLDCPFMDIENYYFPNRVSNQPYQNARSEREAVAALLTDARNRDSFVFASVRGHYTAELEGMFTCAIYVKTPKPVRMARMRERSFQKFGERMLPGGDLYESEERFFEMAQRREDAYVEDWLRTLSIPVFTVDGTLSVARNAEMIIRYLSTEPRNKLKAASLLETTLNTRDLGGYQAQTGSVTRWLSLLRSDMMKRPSENDLYFLRANRVTTVIDMRGEKDTSVAPSPFAGMDDFCYHNVPIEEGGGVPESTSDVPYSYMRIAGAKRMPEVFRRIACAENGVLFHCSAGKDRTGVVSAILLSLACVGERDIVENYMLTRTCNQPRFEVLHQRFPDIDMNIVIPHEEYIASFLSMFQSQYGGAEQYLKKRGLSDTEIERLRGKLLWGVQSPLS